MRRPWRQVDEHLKLQYCIGGQADYIVRTAEGWRIARRQLTTVRLITVGST